MIGAYLQSMLELEEPAMLAPSSFILTFVLTHAGGACYACAFILRPYLQSMLKLEEPAMLGVLKHGIKSGGEG